MTTAPHNTVSPDAPWQAGQFVRNPEKWRWFDEPIRKGSLGRIVAAEAPPHASEIYPDEYVLWVSFEPGCDSQDEGKVVHVYGTDATPYAATPEEVAAWEAADAAYRAERDRLIALDEWEF